MDGDDALERELGESRRRLARLQADLDDIFQFQQDAPPDDEHDIEGSSVAFERAAVTALLEAERARLASLEEAVARRAGGSYGRCEVCGEPIGEERLEALPAATRCVGCAGP